MDNLWIATTGSGLYKVRVDSSGEYEIKNFSQKNGLPGNRFRNICELKDGRIAVAGDYGVAFLRGDSVEKVFTAQDGFANEKSLCLLEYKNGCYVGSDGGGISKIENDKIVKNIGKKDGLSSNVILRMVYDSFSDGVFIVTSNGICYTSAKGEVKKLDNFPYSNNYDIICDPDGTCWILGSAGIFVAQSKDLIENLKTEYAPLTAHLFVFYFACLSAITPPVALAAYAGAGIAKTNPMTTAVEACKLGFAGFMVPFAFCYNPAMMMQGSVGEIISVAISAIIGVAIMSAGFQGWLLWKLNWLERIVFIAGGLLMFIPGTLTDITGLVIAAALLLVNVKKWEKGPKFIMDKHKAKQEQK